MSEETKEPTTSPAAILFNGTRVRVYHEKEAVKLKTFPKDKAAEYVTVRLIPFRDMPRALEICDQEAELVAFVTGQPVEWTDTLTEQSLLAILKANEEVNSPRLAAFVARKTERISSLFGGK